MSQRFEGEGLGMTTRPLVVVAAFAVVTMLTSLVAYPSIFANFAPYDDEGGFLISLDSFLSEGSLYDEVFSQYGPFYYELWGGLFTLLDVSVTHDAGRAVTLTAWVITSLLIGFFVLRLTGSVLLGIASQLLAFAAIASLVIEPMHPGGLTCVLVALIVATSTFVGGSRAAPAMALLGALLAALVLVKVNVGAFALAAVALACAASYPAVASRGVIRAAIEAGFVITPVVLMAERLDESWAREYAASVAAAALAVVLLLRTWSADRSRRSRELVWLGGAFATAAILICAVIVLTGSSPSALLEGVITRPLGQEEAFSYPVRLPGPTLPLSLLALVAAAAWVVRARRAEWGTPWTAGISLASIAVGVELGLTAIGRSFPFDPYGSSPDPIQLTLVGFAWMALMPLPGVPARPGVELSRRLLPALAVLQALHAYPVAGSQLGWSAFLLVPVGAVCVGNGVRGLARALDGGRRGSTLAAGSAAALALGWFVVDTTIREPLRKGREEYNAWVPLDLPGAESMRLPPLDAEAIRRVTAVLKQDCGMFLSLPGLNSFYLWSGHDPPTGLNATHWMTLFDEDDQRRVIAATRSTRHLCLLENQSMVRFWLRDGQLPEGPLAGFMRERFEPFARFGPYELKRRVQEAGPVG